MAVEPGPTIVSPAQGSSTLEATPRFSGTTNGTPNPVTVAIYVGSSATGTPVQEPSTSVGPLEAEWSLTPSPLVAGTTTTYTAVAEEAGALGEPTTSAPVTFTVDAPPTVTGNPASETVTDGQEAMFTASASGTPNPTVQWQVLKEGTWTTIPNESADTLTFTTTAKENGAQLRALFTNSGGSTPSEPATLTVETAVPIVTTQPKSVTTVVAGGTASFTAEAFGIPSPEVQWQVRTSSTAKWTNVSGAGANEDTLKVTHTTASESGREYQAVFTNEVGTAASEPATLTVETAVPFVTTQPVPPKSVTSVVAGETASFTAEASGIPSPEVQWQVRTSSGSKWMNVSGAGGTKDTLEVANTTISESGREYQAVFTNEVGAATSNPALLTVARAPEPPSEISSPASVRVTAGALATFTAGARGGVPTPQVQWQVSTDFGSTWTNDTGDTGNTSDFLNVVTSASENGYEYRALFANNVGSSPSAAATLIVESPPPPPQQSNPSTTSSPPADTTPPTASFTWFPAFPHVGEVVSLASSSTDLASALTAFGWDLTGNGPFAGGASVQTTSFSTAGNHVVRLQVTDAAGLSGVVAETIPVSSAHVLMQPFPIVRIAGSDTPFGVRLSLLSAQAPVGARITLTCRGGGCPLKQEIRVVASAHSKAGAVVFVFKRFERTLRAGIVLQIRVWKPGQIGKYTSFTVRRGKLPVRVDTCLDPTTSKPIACPAS
jgi:hypothetical protein